MCRSSAFTLTVTNRTERFQRMLSIVTEGLDTGNLEKETEKEPLGNVLLF